MEDFIMDSTFAAMLTEPIVVFDKNLTKVDVERFVEDWMQETEPREFTVVASVSPETMYNDFVTSLDREELEFLADYSACSEYLIASPFQEIHFQMMSTL